jgi:hypothetical protein
VRSLEVHLLSSGYLAEIAGTLLFVHFGKTEDSVHDAYVVRSSDGTIMPLELPIATLSWF